MTASAPDPGERAFFVSSAGTRLDRSGVGKTLRKITTSLGMRTETVHPRAHDLRHSFAVDTLIRWQRSGLSVDEHIVTLSTYLGHVSPADTDWDLSASPELMDGRPTAAHAIRRTAMTALAPALQAYFTDRLIGQRAASPNTIGAYKLTFRPLLTFASKRLAKTPAALDIAELDAPLIAAFLDHLERDRRNSAATRNNRLAAIHSLFGYLALHRPEHAGSIAARARHPTQTNRTQPAHLPHRPRGRRAAGRLRSDHLDRTARSRHVRAHHPDGTADLRARRTRPPDVTLTVGANVHTIGKGRKERRTPLVASTKAILHAWLSECPGAASDPLFPTITGSRLSRDAIERRLAHHVAIATAGCPSLRPKPVTMHTLRHTAAMRLLLAGNDVTVIALWLGHEQLSTTNITCTPT